MASRLASLQFLRTWRLPTIIPQSVAEPLVSQASALCSLYPSTHPPPVLPAAPLPPFLRSPMEGWVLATRLCVSPTRPRLPHPPTRFHPHSHTLPCGQAAEAPHESES